MVVQHHPHAGPDPTQSRADLRLVAVARHRARVHLLTYLAGNAFFWVLWGAISVSADDWYWWPLVPFAGWTLVLALHLWYARAR